MRTGRRVPGAKRAITDEQVEAVIIRHLGNDAARRDAWEYSRDGKGGRPESHGDQRDLARWPTSPDSLSGPPTLGPRNLCHEPS